MCVVWIRPGFPYEEGNIGRSLGWCVKGISTWISRMDTNWLDNGVWVWGTHCLNFDQRTEDSLFFVVLGNGQVKPSTVAVVFWVRFPARCPFSPFFGGSVPLLK